MALFDAFIVYQRCRYTFTHSLWLLAMTAFAGAPLHSAE